ncbi:EcsC family protein [Nocardioides caldifontis]|uniref:EcsC family protein n=1 Tax=Nocardioides caldifontis TaxID=2588938 RepID=UPI0011DFE06B|nr:EcsC family protein [Nocardioides caldifontis]
MIRQAILKKVMPDVHRVAPDLNAGFVHQTVQRAIHGVGPLPPAAAAADKQLEEQGGDVDRAIQELIENHTSLAAAQGFVTNLGGLVTMAATVPVNITGMALLQCRMVAGIAYLRGYDLTDGRVRNAVLLCTLGEDTVKELVKQHKVPGTPMVVATAPAYDPELDKVVAAEVTTALVNRVIGKRAAGTVARRIPVAGGVYGAGSDGYATWQVGKYAARELRSRNKPAELTTDTKRRWPRR